MDKSTKELLAQAEKLCAQRNVRLTLRTELFSLR